MMMTAVLVDTYYSTGSKYRQDVCAWQNQKHLKNRQKAETNPQKSSGNHSTEMQYVVLTLFLLILI